MNPVDAASMYGFDTSHLGMDVNNPSVNNPNDAAMMRFLGHINPDTQREHRAEHRNAAQAAVASRGEQLRRMSATLFLNSRDLLVI